MSLYPTTNPARKRRNKVNVEDKAIHDWYRFVLSFPPHLVHHYLDQFQVTAPQVVLDPFSGTGTTLVECKKLGIPCIGIEANPMAHFASQTKLDWSISPSALLDHAANLATLSKNDLTLLSQMALKPALMPGAQKLLFKNAISAGPLQKVLTLLGYIEKSQTAPFYNHERLALAKAAVLASNLRFAPEIGVSRQLKTDAPVIELWQSAITQIANDLTTLSNSMRPLEQKNSSASLPISAQVHCGDARTPSQYLPKQSIDVVITSPPYPNEKDYTRATRLESVLLGFLTNKVDLQTVKKTLVRSNSRGIYTQDTDDRWAENYPEVLNLAQEIENRRIKLGKTSGFSRLYARATKLYFGGMAKHLADLRQVLQPNAQLAYVVGDQASYLQVHIQTGQILANIAQDLGYELLSIDLFRTRRASKTDLVLREEVILLRWPG